MVEFNYHEHILLKLCLMYGKYISSKSKQKKLVV